MLADMTSVQAAEWFAYATIEQIGNPVPNVKTKEGQKKERRARVESGLRSLMEKQNA